MTDKTKDFAYWLQGFSELNPDLKHPSEEQWKLINRKLNDCFTNITGKYNFGKPVSFPVADTQKDC